MDFKNNVKNIMTDDIQLRDIINRKNKENKKEKSRVEFYEALHLIANGDIKRAGGLTITSYKSNNDFKNFEDEIYKIHQLEKLLRCRRESLMNKHFKKEIKTEMPLLNFIEPSPFIAWSFYDVKPSKELTSIPLQFLTHPKEEKFDYNSLEIIKIAKNKYKRKVKELVKKYKNKKFKKKDYADYHFDLTDKKLKGWTKMTINEIKSLLKHYHLNFTDYELYLHKLEKLKKYKNLHIRSLKHGIDRVKDKSIPEIKKRVNKHLPDVLSNLVCGFLEKIKIEEKEPYHGHVFNEEYEYKIGDIIRKYGDGYAFYLYVEDITKEKLKTSRMAHSYRTEYTGDAIYDRNNPRLRLYNNNWDYTIDRDELYYVLDRNVNVFNGIEY
jgi:hypothetical protein